MKLEGGTVDAVEDTLYIDCTANGLAKTQPRPVYSPGRVTLQPVFMCQQTFSAALIAHIERLDLSDDKRNEICAAVPHPELKEDLLGALLTSTRNVINWNRHMPFWVRRSRLNLGHEEAPHRYLLAATKLTLLQRRAVASMNRLLAA
jgi:hypothetical protein